MANMAECAIAIALEDLPKLNGAIRKRENGEVSVFVCERKYRNAQGEQYILADEWHEGAKNAYGLKKGRDVVAFTGENWEEMQAKIKELGLVEDLKDPDYYAVKTDTFCDGDWCIDWVKLHSFSYDYTPMISEYDDHITIIFGGRWDFPEPLETFLNSLNIKWQGAGCEDGCDWQCDDFGTYDFGLRIGRERDEDYYYHFVYDASND